MNWIAESIINSERRNFEHEQFSAKGVHIYFQLNSEKCVQYKPLKRNGKNLMLKFRGKSKKVHFGLPRWSFWGNKFGTDGTNMLFAEKVRHYQLLFTCITSENSIKDLMPKILKGLNLGHFDPFSGRNPEPELC